MKLKLKFNFLANANGQARDNSVQSKSYFADINTTCTEKNIAIELHNFEKITQSQKGIQIK